MIQFNSNLSGAQWRSTDISRIMQSIALYSCGLSIARYDDYCGHTTPHHTTLHHTTPHHTTPHTTPHHTPHHTTLHHTTLHHTTPHTTPHNAHLSRRSLRMSLSSQVILSLSLALSVSFPLPLCFLPSFSFLPLFASTSLESHFLTCLSMSLLGPWIRSCPLLTVGCLEHTGEKMSFMREKVRGPTN